MNEKLSMHHETNSVWNVSNESPKIAPADSFEVPFSPSSTILPEDGYPPHPKKIKKELFFFKWFLGNFSVLKLLFKNEEKITENWSAADPTQPN